MLSRSKLCAGAYFHPLFSLRRVKDISTSKDLGYRVNEQIRAPKVRVVDENGKQIGVFITSEAIRMAKTRGFDLVEVAPSADPPVCRFIDYDKFRYEMVKKAKEAKKNQTVIEVKEIRLRLGTDVHDMETKTKKIREFLEDGNKVKVTLRPRGRERSLEEQIRQKLLSIAEKVADVGQVEQDIKSEGRNFFFMIGPKKKKEATKDGKGEDQQNSSEEV
ncbi:translation initiation factor IF-3 [Coprothermobacteraceae bacterium]|nr:translation initiation factor IF-3 [Coprothermobacteraceae bacterium]